MLAAELRIPEQFADHLGRMRHSCDVFGRRRRVRHHRVEELGVALPVLARKAHHLQREDRGNGRRVVEDEVELAALDHLVQEPGGDAFHIRTETLDRGGREHWRERAPQIVVLRSVDLRQALGRSLRPWVPHDSLVRDAVGSVRLELVHKDVGVARDRHHLVVAGDEPEPLVGAVIDDRAGLAQFRVSLEPLVEELLGVGVQIDDRSAVRWAHAGSPYSQA